MDLPALADFVLVASHGGLGKAARATGRPKATLSRHLRELEESLGVRLIERGPHALRLTEDGAALHLRAKALLGEIEEVGEALRSGGGRQRSTLRISAPMVFGHVALARLASRFVRAYPEVQVEVVSEDRISDPVEDGFDIVIRVNPRPSADLVGRCILRDRMWLVSAPDAELPPAASDDGPTPLSAAVLIRPGEIPAWRVDLGGEIRSFQPEPVLRLSSVLMVREAVLAGVGAALLPGFVLADDRAQGRLRVWGYLAGPENEIWALHPSRRLASPKVTAFMEWLRDLDNAGVGPSDNT